MSTQREIARKFRQLDNDVSSIYEILDRVQATQLRHGTRLDRIDTRLDRMDTRLDGIDGKLGMVVELLERR